MKNYPIYKIPQDSMKLCLGKNKNTDHYVLLTKSIDETLFAIDFNDVQQVDDYIKVLTLLSKRMKKEGYYK